MTLRRKIPYKTFLRSFYAYRFFTDLALVYPVYIILFKRNGLSVLQISLLLALWSGFVILFEVPTGALADRWSRKNMLILGLLSKAVGFGIWLFADRFWIFALGFLFWGVQETFCSGSQEALLFDNLKDYNKEEAYEQIAGKGHFYARIAIAVSMFLGGVIASFDFNAVIILSSASMLFGIIPVLFFREIRSDDLSKIRIKYTEVLRQAFRFSRNNKTVMRLFLYAAVVVAVVGILDEVEQLYYDRVHLPLAFFGFVMVGRMVFEALGSRFAHRFQRDTKDLKDIYILGILSGLLLLSAAAFRSLFLILPFALVFFFGSAGEVLVEGRLQRQIETDQRATILSIHSLLINASAIVFMLGFGLLSRAGRLTWGFLFFALLLIVFSSGSLVRTYFTSNRKRENLC
jgi:MFS family permease